MEPKSMAFYAIAYDSYGGGLRSFKFYIYIFSRCLNTLTFFAQAQAHSFSARKRKSESISARAAKAPRCLITIKRNDNFITANTLPKVQITVQQS